MAEAVDPVASYGAKALDVERVDPLTSPEVDMHQPGIFECPEVSSRRWPGTVEPRGDLSGGHFPSSCVQDGKDCSAGLVCEGAEYVVKVLEVR